MLLIIFDELLNLFLELFIYQLIRNIMKARVATLANWLLIIHSTGSITYTTNVLSTLNSSLI